MKNLFKRNLEYGKWSLPKGDVYVLQEILEELGYGDFVPTGFFGTKTLEAVQSFQRNKGIFPSSGHFGPKTRPALLKEISDLRRELIYAQALNLLGTDVTPTDVVPDEFDCANTVSAILTKAGFGIGNIISTTVMYKHLLVSNLWDKVTDPLPGDIIISPTGYGNGGLSNGHVGFCAEDKGENIKIMSNDSYSGKFKQNYTLVSWRKRYEGIGGFPVVFFRRL